MRPTCGVAESSGSANPPARARHGAEDASVTALLVLNPARELRKGYFSW